MKCKHRRVGVGETVKTYLSYEIDNGELLDSGKREGDNLGYVVIECHDCGYRWEGKRHAKSTPKWIKDLFEVIDDSTADW